ncbi:DUF4157 domain-containing protein [Paenibacillus sp. MBLB4367]|uniref:eCIS core domain-containing protein n=1 Tax=Paenibacillus sp. MBLB4367 TaxID=3384767 RepID=UPI00390835BD
MHQYDRKIARAHRSLPAVSGRSAGEGRTSAAGPHASFMQLQQTAGNRAVQRMLAGTLHGQAVQRMDLEGAEGEEEELQMKRDGAVQRMDLEGTEGEEEELQMKRDGAVQRMDIEGAEGEEEELQMKRDGAVQRMELEGAEGEEEELQMKRDGAVQRMDIEGAEGEEEELQMKRDGAVQRMDIEGAEGEEEELQMKRDGAVQRMDLEGAEGEEEELQMKRDGAVQRKEPNGGMPEQIRTKMESAMGADFSDVRIHEGSEASNIGALAYTRGSNVHFAPGKYDPFSQPGQELLGHELAHVVQQRQGRVKPTTQVSGVPVNDDRGLEQEADDMGRKAASFAMAPSAAGVQRKPDASHQAHAASLLQGKKSDGESVQRKSFSRMKS